MKTIRKYKLVLFLCAILLTTAGCKKFLDINSNPATPQVIKAEYMLSRIIFQMANGTSQDYMQVSKLVQYWTSIDVNDIYERHGFSQTSDVTGVIWRMNYADLGLNLQGSIDDAVANQKYEYAGIGYAIKAWSFQMTTDMYGDIILDDAFDPTMLRFRYQNQKDVYERVREWSALAIKYLNMKSPVNYAPLLAGSSGDYIYKGNLDRWKKFVYGNLALHYNHLINKPNYASTYADSVLKYVDLSFASTAEDATVKFTGSTAEDSNVFGPAYGVITGTSNGRISTTILNLLTGGVRGEPTPQPETSLDPRLTRLLTPVPVPGNTDPTVLGVYKGNTPTKGTVTAEGGATPHVLGMPSGPVTDPYPGKYIFSNKTQYPLMSYAQLQFVKAEALFIKGNKGAALIAYQNGIRAHMDFINAYGTAGPNTPITAAEITPYMLSSEVAQTEGDLTISDIMNQKYIAQWGWAALEQWCDLRKYHYDPTVFTQYYQLSGAEIAVNNGGKLAYRYRPRYNSEYMWNEAELEKLGGLEPDYNTKETWFSTAEN